MLETELLSSSDLERQDIELKLKKKRLRFGDEQKASVSLLSKQYLTGTMAMGCGVHPNLPHEERSPLDGGGLERWLV